MLLLPCFPCNDSNEVSNNEITVIASGNCNNNHKEVADCNPFCICSCCSNNISFNSLSYKIELVKPFLQQKQNFSNNSFFLSSDYLNKIWQPPKLS
jgi:hypothetical protein